MRRLRRPASGLWSLLLVLGPGVVAANAGNDAGTLAAYASIGAKLGYQLLWALVLLTVSFAVVQETAARLGAATGRGLLDLVRERFGIGWALLAIVASLVANGSAVVTEFVGIGAAAQLLGVSRAVAVPAAALVIWYLVIRGRYDRVERLLLVLTLAFFAYVIAAVLARPDWASVARGAVSPSVPSGADGLLLLVALFGATLTPYQQLFQQSAIVEKGVAHRHYGPERADAYLGAVLSNLVAGFVIVASGATLHAAGITDIQSAADAARALEPVAGPASATLFSTGLLGASLLAAGVVPLATTYAVAETFGFRKGVNLDFRRAPFFFGTFSALIGVGAVVALIPDVPVIPLLVGIQVLNGVLLPVTLVFLLLLINDRRLAGHLRNGWLNNLLGWGTLTLVTVTIVAMLGGQAMQLIGAA